MFPTSRWLVFVAGLIGAAGVAAAAAASHGGESRNLAAISAVFLAHAPALIALGLFGKGRILQGAAVGLVVGTVLFGADLGMREFAGHSLFSGAAPTGGGLMILSWIGIALGGLSLGTRRI